MGLFDMIRADKPKEKNTPTPADLFLRGESEKKKDEKLDLNPEPFNEEPEEPEFEEPEPEPEPIDLTLLAKTGASMDISNYLSNDDAIDMSIIPNSSGSGLVIVRCEYDDNKEPKELFRADYLPADPEGLKKIILTAVKTSYKRLSDEEEAFDLLDEYLNEIEDEIGEE